jgi:hypothetical protein
MDTVRAYILERIASLQRENAESYSGQLRSYNSVRVEELKDVLNFIESDMNE